MSRIILRRVVTEIERRLSTSPDLIQVLTGPRQVGKTTAARSLETRWDGPVHRVAADLPPPPGPEWIIFQWQRARTMASHGRALLILDEVQKVSHWSEAVKALWDEDREKNLPLAVLLLGSSALLLGKGTAESLAGRFFPHRCLHWSLGECQEAFGWDMDRWLYFGGYPGAALLAEDEEAWRRYVVESLIETVLARDVFAMQNIAKPALLRHLFAVASCYPGQILSYNKMLGQLQDAGNTTTLSHYLRLLESAYLISGLERFSRGRVRTRGSSPKLVLWNNALTTSIGSSSFAQARGNPALWGRLVENAVGGHLINHLHGLTHELTYWRDRNDEVDFVVRCGDKIWAIEVKSGLPKPAKGLAAFMRKHPTAHPLILGPGGLPLADFFLTDPKAFFS